MSAGLSRHSRADSLTSNSLHKVSIPAVPTPLPARRLAIYYTPNGLILVPVQHSHTHTQPSQPQHADKQQASGSSTKQQYADGARITWGNKPRVESLKGAQIAAALESIAQTEECRIECFALAGIVKLFYNSYLYVITRRSHEGDFFSSTRPVYKCTGVLAIPLNAQGSQAVMKAELKRAKAAPPRARQDSPEGEQDDEDEDAQEDEEDGEDEDEIETPSVLRRDSYISGLTGSKSSGPPSAPLRSNGSSERETDAIAGVTPTKIETNHLGPQKTVDGDTPPSLPEPLQEHVDGALAHPEPAQGDLPESKSTLARAAEYEANKTELEDKLVKEGARQLARGELYFGYDFDLTTSLQLKYEQLVRAGAHASSEPPFEEPRPTLPLWRRAERRFWHNEHLMADFIEAGLHAFIVPLMQGFFTISSLPLETDEPLGKASAQLMLVSRRGKERPGLRFQRRGVNEAGQVANYVETEQLLLLRQGSQTHLFTFVQIRGSIPLFWSQSPFSLKPPPVLERSADENEKACSRHFAVQTERYGSVTCVNLAEQSGKEGEITAAYKNAVEHLKEKGNKVGYTGFDFHKECAGMQFQNISKLIDILRDTITEMDCFWRAWGVNGDSTSTVMSQQRGVFRVSCLDCLDRTNVAQTHFSKHMLQIQLARVGIALKAPHPRFDSVVANAWADNGDQISREYAGSKALKGDFTRTGKRNLVGMINDASNSVYRLIQGATMDFFRQTTISFLYGELSLKGLERYWDELQTLDPSKETRLARIRAAAIETCTSMAVPEGESKLAGWTLFGPLDPNTVRSDKLEEKIVIMTEHALYVCAFDFTIERLCEFSRILLSDLVAIQKGPYVLASREGYQPEQHWGMILRYRQETARPLEVTADEKRAHEEGINGADVDTNVAAGKANEPEPEVPQFVALKAVSDNFVGTLSMPTPPSPAGLPPTHSWIAASEGGSPSASAYVWDAEGKSASDLTSRDVVDRVVSMIVLQRDGSSSASTPLRVEETTIQSLAQAKAQSSMFGLAGLVEGVKRRVWL